MIPFAQPFAAGGIHQPAFVQATNATDLQAATYASANTPGSLLLAHYSHASGDTAPTSVSDTQGNTWIKAGTFSNATNAQDSDVWYAENARGGANTVTMQGTQSSRRLSILEASGVAKSNSLITSISATGTASPVASGNIFPTQGYSYLVGCLQMFGATITPGSGWVSETVDTNKEAIIHDQVLTSAAPVALNPTFTGSSNWLAIILAFRPEIS